MSFSPTDHHTCRDCPVIILASQRTGAAFVHDEAGLVFALVSAGLEVDHDRVLAEDSFALIYSLCCVGCGTSAAFSFFFFKYSAPPQDLPFSPPRPSPD